MSEISQIRALYGTDISSEMISTFYHQKIEEYIRSAEILPLVYKPALAELYTEYADELIRQKNYDEAVSMLTRAFLIYQSLWEKEHSKYDGCLQRTLNTLKSIRDEEKPSLRRSIRTARIKVNVPHDTMVEGVFRIRRPNFVGHAMGRRMPGQARRAVMHKTYITRRRKGRKLLKLKKTGED